ncbi:MAG: hypothetical protein K0Q73_6548 [Paenibacillus sp.]|jgi:hypothetical protein|nr:hypothetical protein [Paenibacillus sp.]
MGQDEYKFANLSVHPDLILEIEKLENKFKEELGEEITLIAYTPNQE